MSVKVSLPEHRCSCGHLLFKGQLIVGTIEVKCTDGRCRALNTVTGVMTVAEYALDKTPAAVVT